MKMTDRTGRQIEEGMMVKYQVGSKFEAIFTLKKDKHGILRFHFPNGDGYDMEGCSRYSAWYQPSDHKISQIID